jgi:hypothetical protein
MWLGTLLALICTLWFSVPLACGQLRADTAEYTVSGTVVNSVTGEGIGGALVQMYANRQRAKLTGADGKFQFEGLPRGTFTVVAQKPGYFSPQQLGGTRQPWITVDTEQTPPPVVVKLIPEGVLAGRVTGEDGEPVESLPVQLFSERVENGKRMRTQSHGTSTDEQGEFRVAELQPGKYFVFIGPSPFPVAFPTKLSQQGARGYPAAFYPGATDMASATPIEITPGKHVEINLTLSAHPFYRISGTVGGYAPDRGVNLEITNAAGQPMNAGFNFDAARGTFQTQWVPAGTYAITALAQDPQNQQEYSAAQSVNLASDVSSVHLMLLPNVNVPVHCHVEWTRTDAQPLPTMTFFSRRGNGLQKVHENIPAQVTFIPQDQFRPPQQRVLQAMPDDTVGVPNVAPGTYRVEIMPNGPYYVESARYGSVNLLEQNLTIAPGGGVQGIEIVLRDDFATLAGSIAVTGEEDTATIVAIPEDSQKQIRTAIAGRGSGIDAKRGIWFQLSQLPPGAYRVLAVSGSGDFEYTNPELLGKYLAASRSVTLTANQTTKIELEMVKTRD